MTAEDGAGAPLVDPQSPGPPALDSPVLGSPELVGGMLDDAAGPVLAEQLLEGEELESAVAAGNAGLRPSDQATADQATADQATADQATADQATADQATADQGPFNPGGPEDGLISRAVLHYLVSQIVERPEDVEIVVSDDRRGLKLSLHVAPDDMGKVIGRRGRIAQAMRTVVRAAGAQEGRDVFVDIVD